MFLVSYLRSANRSHVSLGRPASISSDLRSQQGVADERPETGKVLTNGLPHDCEINPEVLVDEAIAHPDDV